MREEAVLEQVHKALAYATAGAVHYHSATCLQLCSELLTLTLLRPGAAGYWGLDCRGRELQPGRRSSSKRWGQRRRCAIVNHLVACLPWIHCYRPTGSVAYH